ncbi:MAG: radical SAM protein [Methylococcales bacterium]
MNAISIDNNYFYDAINRLLNQQVEKEDILMLLGATGEVQNILFEQARAIRSKHTNDIVRLRGVIEISNYCQKSCNYCAIRAPNSNMQRYRMTPDEIMDIARQIRELGIEIIFLQAGQDPKCDAIMEEVIPKIKKELQGTVLLCLGEKPKEVYRRYRELGADSYILKYETSDPLLYQQIALTPLNKRLECARWIQEFGMQLGVGNMIGLPGQSYDSLAEDILLGYQMKPDFVSASPFIANQDTPYEDVPTGDFNITLNTMAINRILHKTSLIPTVSALEKIQADGQLMGLNAGANVITINFTPPVKRDQFKIYSKERFIVSREHASRIIEKAGLKLKAG